jgi:hypothetical protein
MDAASAHLISVIQKNRDRLIQETTDISFASGTIAIPREGVEQMLTGVMALTEEALVGTSREMRQLFLETALPEATNTTSWPEMLKNGLPCWGLLIGRVTMLLSEEHRDAGLTRLSRIMGEWWMDVSNAVLPLYKARGEL